jgi:succinyl-diaminopimelate desuccinylase
MSIYRESIEKYKASFLKDLSDLVAIPSVSDETKAMKNAPFGPDVRACFDAYKKIAIRLGFTVEDDDGYAICATYADKETDDHIGILGHLDVVSTMQQKWDTDPYTLTMQQGILYGRGVNDDKGPLLSNLYAVRILRDMGYVFQYPIKIIAGGAEETTWHCMEHYFNNHKQPLWAYSPDGNFPIVNGEKGILTYQTTYLKKQSVIEIVAIQG